MRKPTDRAGRSGWASRTGVAGPGFLSTAVLAGALLVQGCSSPSWFSSTSNETSSLATQEYARQFKEIDTAGKGVITLDQALEHYTRKFAELDRNKDGFLDEREIEPMLPIMQAQTGKDLVRAIDNSGDGKVSLKEFHITANWLFARARSQDGSLSVADVGKPQDKPKSTAPAAGPPQGGGMPDRGGPPSSRI